MPAVARPRTSDVAAIHQLGSRALERGGPDRRHRCRRHRLHRCRRAVVRPTRRRGRRRSRKAIVLARADTITASACCAKSKASPPRTAQSSNVRRTFDPDWAEAACRDVVGDLFRPRLHFHFRRARIEPIYSMVGPSGSRIEMVRSRAPRTHPVSSTTCAAAIRTCTGAIRLDRNAADR